MRLTVIFLTLFVAFPSYAIDIVYVRIKRTVDPMVIVNDDGTEKIVKNLDVYDFLPEVDRRIDRFNGPGQLVMRKDDGTETVIYDCMEATPSCVPMDPMVSFDGKKVLFTVLTGKIQNLRLSGRNHPNTYFRTSESSRLHMWDSISGEVTALPHVDETYDLSPVWLQNGRIMFSSNRSGVHGTYMENGNPQKHPAFQLWTSELDGSDPRLIGQHIMNSALHPYVLNDGRVIYSTWRIEHMLPYRSQGLSTVANKWWIEGIGQDGGGVEAVFGAHTTLAGDPSNKFTIKALHFLGQRSNGDICTTNYYRRNNQGSGEIICWPPEPRGIEGVSPYIEAGNGGRAFEPRGMYKLTKWATSTDHVVLDNEGKGIGKLRDPEGLPDGNMMVALARGICHSITQGLSAAQAQERGCDLGIYRTTKIPSDSKDDLELIVDTPEWHEIMARTMSPYSSVYGIDSPPAVSYPRSVDGSCYVRSASLSQEILPNSPYRFGQYRACSKQGCSAQGLVDKITGLRIWGQKHWPNPPGSRNTTRTTVGHMQEFWGDVPILDDGSSVFEVPCDTPFIMTGITDEGLVVARDQAAQSLRPAEERTCSGCHLHSEKGPSFNGTSASLVAEPTKVGFDEEYKIYEYTTDIAPILQAKCVECHGGLVSSAGPRMDIEGSGLGSTYWNLVWNREAGAPGVSGNYHRPNSSKYVNAAFAAESLLYWKVVNSRTDGRSDNDYEDDVDFGADHPTNLTDEEIATFRRWLDSGALYMASIDPPPLLPVLSIGDQAVTEGNPGGPDATIVFTVTRTGDLGAISGVDYTVSPGSAATPGDYNDSIDSLSGALTFAAGVSSQSITLDVTDDLVPEDTENFTVTLSNESNASIIKDTGVGAISDDDTAPPIDDGIVDNNDQSTSSTGIWIVSSVSGAYGGNSMYCNSNCSFTWSYEILVSGYFQVAATWTYHVNRSHQVPYTIEHASGPTTVVVDQHDQSLEKEFQPLGVFWFDAGDVAAVTISPDNGQANADAVRFMQMEFCPVE